MKTSCAVLAAPAALIVAVGAAQSQAVATRREVADPGVIATLQRVVPAGLQSAFDGRVGGVRFGASSDEVWVAAPGRVYRLDWRANRIVASAPVDGRPGVYALARDAAAHRLLMSSVGHLPAAAAVRDFPDGSPVRLNREVARLLSFDERMSSDSSRPVVASPALGDFMAGAPAIAARASASGTRFAVLPLPANDALAVLDAETGAVVRMVPLGVEPIAAAIASDGTTAFVSLLGGSKPAAGERSAHQCCDPRAEAVRVDARGIAMPGSVVRVDLVTGRVVASVSVGRHPTAILLDEQRERLYVADGNADSVSVVDTRSNKLAFAFPVARFRERQIGLAPTALGRTADGSRLFVALGGLNAVAVFDAGGAHNGARPTLEGFVPTSWYPSSLDVSPDDRYLAVGSLLGVGSGSGEAGPPPGNKGRFALAVRGAVNVIELPGRVALAAYTTAVARNAGLTLESEPRQATPTHRDPAPPRAVPAQHGDPSLIRHVVFIIRENRTFDQVLGDLGRGSTDSSLVVFGRDVTPNAHALSEQFVTIDHFFASGGNSADGHQWLTQANETEYPMWPLYFGRSYPSEGIDPLAYSSGGFLWEKAHSRRRSVTIFGEYAPTVPHASPNVRAQMLDDYAAAPADFARQRALLARRYNTHSDIPSLDRTLVREYPGWTQEVPDVVKAGDILSHLADWERARQMPELTMIILPNDHTEGTTPGWCTPRACVADNDFALGKIVDGLSHSRFWSDMAIMVVEDDAQAGVDHVDGHRTVALAISPYSRRGAVDSTFYSQPSMVKTVELMLGLSPMSLFDLVAPDMRASFISPGERSDITPYRALVPRQSLAETNARIGSIVGPHAAERRRAARASSRMNFSDPDDAPTETLNRILWADARGWHVPYPRVRRSVFFPMAADVPDADRPHKLPRVNAGSP